jgi:prefoldin subunit 5
MRLSDDAIERYIHRYQQMLAARQHDSSQLAAAYAEVDAVILSIDGLQPEKGHETLLIPSDFVVGEKPV